MTETKYGKYIITELKSLLHKPLLTDVILGGKIEATREGGRDGIQLD